jgi:hypothetical protein
MTTLEQFMVITPRHQRVLTELNAVKATAQKMGDTLDAIGWGALRDEDDPFSYDQLFGPLLNRGMIEDLTATELGSGGKYFVRITQLGIVCMSLGLMLRDERKPTINESLELLNRHPNGRTLSESVDISGEGKLYSPQH